MVILHLISTGIVNMQFCRAAESGKAVWEKHLAQLLSFIPKFVSHGASYWTSRLLWVWLSTWILNYHLFQNWFKILVPCLFIFFLMNFESCCCIMEFVALAGIYANIQGKQDRFLIEIGLCFCNWRYTNSCKFSFISIPWTSFKFLTLW